MNAIDIAGTFLDGAEIGATTDTIEIFLAHFSRHPARVIIEHDRQIGRAIDGERMKRVLTRCRLGVGRSGHKKRVIPDVGHRLCKPD